MAYTPTSNPFYKGNANLPKAGTKKDITLEQAQEVARCIQDPVYFAETYFKVVHQDADDGVIPMILYPYQKEAIDEFIKTNRLLMATARQVGKVEPLNNKIPLHAGGFTTMGNVNVGDVLIGSLGQPINVTYKTQLLEFDSYNVTFDDGTIIEVGGNHDWTVVNRINHRKIETKSTERLMQDFRKSGVRGYHKYRYAVENVVPIQYASREQLIDPYILGAWLGGGVSSSSVFGCANDQKQHFIDNGMVFTSKLSYERNSNPSFFTSNISGISPKLRLYNLLGNKHIPGDYLYGSVEQRLLILQGIMDAGGHVRSSGLCEIQLTNKVPRLIEDINQLLCSLGIKVFRSQFQNDNFKVPVPSTRLTFTPPYGMEICRIPYKLRRLKKTRLMESYTNSRSIVNIEKIGTNQGHCIQVDSVDHLYLTSNRYIPTHNTAVATVLILWIALFNKRKNIALVADKQDTATEILDRIQIAYEYLPEFLKGGVKEWNKKSVTFENGSKIFASATGSGALRGKSIFLLYIDEAAHIEDWETFSSAVLGTITASKKSKIVLTSTPNGMNHFYDYYKQAKEGKGDFPLIEVPWWKVEGRDEAWAEKTLRDMAGNVQKFKQEQEVEFLGSSGTLISGNVLARIDCQLKMPLTESEIGLKIFTMPEQQHMYALVADVSRGKDLDHSAFHVFDITSLPYHQVATFYNNTISPTDYATVINQVASNYNNALVLIELNDSGGTVSDTLFLYHQYENIVMTESVEGVGKTVSAQGSRNADRGIKTSAPVRSAGCTMLKLMIEQDQLLIYDRTTLEELKTFSLKKSGTSNLLKYQAEQGKHDDAVMGLVLFAWLVSQPYIKNLLNQDVTQRFKQIEDSQMEDMMAPMGLVVTGLDQNWSDGGTVFEIPSSDFNSWMND